MRYRHTLPELLCNVLPEFLPKPAARYTCCILPGSLEVLSAVDIVITQLVSSHNQIGTGKDAKR